MKDEKEIDLNREFDARVWVKEWLRIIKDHPTIPWDENTMTTWFSSALLAGYSEHQKRANQNSGTSGPKISEFQPNALNSIVDDKLKEVTEFNKCEKSVIEKFDEKLKKNGFIYDKCEGITTTSIIPKPPSVKEQYNKIDVSDKLKPKTYDVGDIIRVKKEFRYRVWQITGIHLGSLTSESLVSLIPLDCNLGSAYGKTTESIMPYDLLVSNSNIEKI